MSAIYLVTYLKERGLQIMTWMLLGLFLLLGILWSSTAQADDFSGNALETEWHYHQTSDQCTLPLYAFDQQQRTDDRGVKLLRDMDDGDWCIETCIATDTFEGQAGLHAGLCVYLDGDNYLYFCRDAEGKILQSGRIGGKEWTGSSTAQDGRYLRIEKKEQTYSFFFSQDGKNWQEAPRKLADSKGLLKGAQAGVMNRTSNRTELFHSGAMTLPCWTVDYGYFLLDGEMIPMGLEKDGWRYIKSTGVFAFAVPPASQATLLRNQKQGDWAIETRLGFTTGDTSTLTGLALYRDEENYLVFGIRGALKGRTVCEVSGVIDGKATGVILTSKGMADDMRGLRILCRTEDGQPDRYYFYTETNGDEYAYACLGCYEDAEGLFRNGQYGLIAINDHAEKALAAQFEYCTETVPDLYTDYFISKVLDEQWTAQGAQKLSVGNSRVTFASNEGESAYLLRQPLKKDWQLDCSVLSLRKDSFAGLALQGEATLQFAVLKDLSLLMRFTHGSEVTERRLEQGALNLRIIKNGDSYSMCFSEDGLSWTEAFRWTDDKHLLDNARCGLTIEGDNCAFRWYSESLRPYGAIEAIEGLDILFTLTGEKSFNQTESRWGFGSGDLGAMFAHNGKVYMVYGDTFAHDRMAGSWIHNAIAVGTVEQPADGVKFTDLYIGAKGNGLVVSDALHTCAMIPSCGFGRDGVLYMWIHEIYSWQSGGHRDISSAGWATSTDDGKTWTYHPMLDGNTKFQFVTCWEEGDELYLFGNYGGGYGETYLMRVDAKKALDPSAYRYYAGTGSNGDALWASSEEEAAIVLNYNEREIGITYNAYLDRYLMTGWDSFNGLMVIHEAPSLLGPWSEAFVLLPRQYTPVENKVDAMTWIYGAYTLPNMVEDGGKSMYFTLSEYNPYQVFWMRVDFRKKND